MMLTKEELKRNITNLINFGDDLLGITMEAQGEILGNYDIRVMTVYCEEDPITSLRYEFEGEKLKLWIATGNGKGMTGIPQYDTFEENLDSVCDLIMGVIDQLGDNYVIDWLGD